MISVKDYLQQTKNLINNGKLSDGCTTPFKTFIHRWLAHSWLLCAAHDFGSLGLIRGVRGGWHNNLHSFIAHISFKNPVYWVWGFIVSVFTLPWVIWRRDIGITFMPFIAFHVALLSLAIVGGAFYWDNYIRL